MAERGVNDDLEFWLQKAKEWEHLCTQETAGHVTDAILADICFRLPALQEFLAKLGDITSHGGVTGAIRRFPLIGQLLGRLCCNVAVVSNGESIRGLRRCLGNFYTAQPGTALERKANEWLQNMVSALLGPHYSRGTEEIQFFVDVLGCSPDVYNHQQNLHMVNSLVKELSGSHWRPGHQSTGACRDATLHSLSLACWPALDLPAMLPLVETLLCCHGEGTEEALATGFLQAAGDALASGRLQLSRAAKESLWLRHLPSLEATVLALVERVAALPPGSAPGRLQSLTEESHLPAACVDHPVLFGAVLGILRALLADAAGAWPVSAIARRFTASFLRARQQDDVQQVRIPLHLYFPALLRPLLPLILQPCEDLPLKSWHPHLLRITSGTLNILRNLTASQTAERHELWTLLVQCGDWADVVLQETLTASPGELDTLLSFLGFYHWPWLTEQQRLDAQASLKATCVCLRDLLDADGLDPSDVTAILPSVHTRVTDVTNQLAVYFLIFAESGRGISEEVLKQMRCPCELVDTLAAAAAWVERARAQPGDPASVRAAAIVRRVLSEWRGDEGLGVPR
ncbi:Fanconi anemia group C protein isoform X2 [Petromyzon marinus]|uniref:Fanconi anemia group C protein isoform X2 n=1 Tax=Petromyzon marinus TaxID=7757 RepID=UPI003F704D23